MTLLNLHAAIYIVYGTTVVVTKYTAHSQISYPPSHKGIQKFVAANPNPSIYYLQWKLAFSGRSGWCWLQMIWYDTKQRRQKVHRRSLRYTSVITRHFSHYSWPCTCWACMTHLIDKLMTWTRTVSTWYFTLKWSFTAKVTKVTTPNSLRRGGHYAAKSSFQYTCRL